MRKLKAFASTVVGALAIAVPVAGGSPPPVSNMDVEVSCTPNPVPGGSAIDCSWKITNTSTSVRSCERAGTFWEAGSWQSGTGWVLVRLAAGETVTGTDSRTTLDTGRMHGGSYRLWIDCSGESGRRTGVRVPFTVTR